MKRTATPSQQSPAQSHSSHRNRYTKVKDHRKHAIRGLWRRGERFYARITVEDDMGVKAVKWMPLDVAKTPAEAQEALRVLLVERQEGRLRHVGQSPKLSDYLTGTYLPRLVTLGKKPDTIVTESGHLKRWREAIGHLRLDKIRPHHVTKHLQSLKEEGRAGRTANLALVCLRNALKSARVDGFIKVLPVEGIGWQRVETKARRLFTRAEIDLFCEAALGASKNGQQVADFIRLLALCGAREQEAIKLRWTDVDFEGHLLTIGAEGDTKNRECRRVDFNAELGAHLRNMFSRRSPTSWLFPSPQRGDADTRAKSFRESLLLTRAVSGWACPQCGKVGFGEAPKACLQCGSTHLEAREKALPEPLQRFGFHDCRHHFISFGVMSGIDYMTLARWVGHKDGGVLIGKVYRHLSNEHARAQAVRINFGPAAVSPIAASNA